MGYAALAIILFITIGLHEFAHAKVADMAGDPTPRSQGRVTLNLTKHFEITGVIMIVVSTLSGFGIGWGKPVMVNPGRMKNPRWDHFASVIAGPMTNVTLALLFAVAYRIIAIAYPYAFNNDFVYALFGYGVFINIVLALFNLIPLGPLDGHWLLGLLLPAQNRQRWFDFNRSQGTILLLVLIVGGQMMSRAGSPGPIEFLIGVPARALYQYLTGSPF